jgi:hypothetical protein
VIWDALRGVSYPAGREQRLGLGMVAASMAIHLGESVRLLR